MRELTVVTSWDDGDVADLRLAELLTSVGLRGTFYVARSTCSLTPGDVRELAAAHEIGSHTVAHTACDQGPLEVWLDDVRSCRAWLEDVTGRPVPSFAYPYGVVTAAASRALRDVVGSARTTLLGATGAPQPDNRWQLYTTVHARSFALRHRLSGVVRGRWAARRPWALRDWPAQARAAASAPGTTVVHLWGHSWEIEQANAWTVLERCLRELAARATVMATVGELVERWGDRAPA